MFSFFCLKKGSAERWNGVLFVYNSQWWITWLGYRWKPQWTAISSANCRYIEREIVECTLRLSSLSCRYVWFRVAFTYLVLDCLFEQSCRGGRVVASLVAIATAASRQHWSKVRRCWIGISDGFQLSLIGTIVCILTEIAIFLNTS